MLIDLIRRYATWWNGATFGTRMFTARNGRLVGSDEMGNQYYTDSAKVRRWVVFAGEVEATSVSPDWHGWLHHTFDAPPTEAPLHRQSWEKAHVPNMTGTAGAYRPPGSISATEPRPARPAYEAWSPE